jgi:hypothetical protein
MKLIHIIDTDQNMWIDVDVFFQQSEMELTQWRSQIREQYKRDKNKPHFTCAWCQSPVTLRDVQITCRSTLRQHSF